MNAAIEQDDHDKMYAAAQKLMTDGAHLLNLIDRRDYAESAIFAESIAANFNAFANAMKPIIMQEIERERSVAAQIDGLA